MPSPRPPDHRDPALPSRGARWLVEVGPLAAIVILLWAKLVYFSALLPSEWWAPEETIIQWMRPAFHVVGAIQRHPEVLGATLAALLVEQRRREARDRLEISDLVIRGNLIQGLTKPWD